MMARASGTVPEAFTVTNGMEQGRVLAPTLFSLMLSVTLNEAYRDERPEISIVYGTDGQPDTRHLNFGTCSVVKQVKVGLSGHISRMNDERPPKRRFYGDVVTVARRQGDQKRHHMGTLKASLKQLELNPEDWEDCAQA
ncbi:hypothetical protein SprV_0200577800 [Sparganum proliferum]